MCDVDFNYFDATGLTLYANIHYAILFELVYKFYVTFSFGINSALSMNLHV